MKRSLIVGIASGFVGLIVLMASTYTIDQAEQVIVLQFKRSVGNPINEPGLKFKLPFIQSVRPFDKRVLEWDGEATEIPTADKRYILVDTFARWRIVNPLTYYRRLRGEERQAQSRLDNFIESAIRNFVSSNLLIEVVRNSNRQLETTIEEEGGFIAAESVAQEIVKGRKEIVELILEKAAAAMPEFGIELLDIRIKRINYREDVRQKVYERMISERKRIAEKYRSEGQGEKAKIDGAREKEFQIISSEAYRRAQEVKGEADAEATKIYANAYNRDPDFYSFIQTLETYKYTMNKNTTLILNTDSDYLKFMKSLRGR